MKIFLLLAAICLLTLCSCPASAAAAAQTPRIKRAEEMRERLLRGAEFSLAETDPDFAAVMNNFIYGDVYHHGDLDERLRALITLVSLTTNQSLYLLRTNVAAALNSGLTPVEVKEAVYHCAPYIGFAKVCDALNVVNEVFREKNIALPLESQGKVNEENRVREGLNLQIKMFGEGMRNSLENAPDNQKHIRQYLSGFCFGDTYTRGGVDLQTRELLTLCILANLGTEAQFKAHVRGNLNMGVGKDKMIAAMTQCLPYMGFPRTLNALRCLDEVIPDNK